MRLLAKPKRKAVVPNMASRVRSAVMSRVASARTGATTDEKLAHRRADSVLLTFDDFGSEKQVISVLQTLARKKVKAMFFLRGDWARTNSRLVRLIRAAGHEVGNHTYSHSNLLELSDGSVLREISNGIASPWLRAPQGRYDDRVRRIAKRLGMKIVYWSIDSDDWQGVPGEYIIWKVARHLHPGAVVLLHLNSDETVAALPDLIDRIRNDGFNLSREGEDLWEQKID
jgi:peptidoglycan/xylan/chitin deacetylase (PgdA/CDA1 family)